MLVAIDIGNTQISIGVYKDQQIVRFWQLATNPKTPVDEYGIILYNLLDHAGYRSELTGAVVASVVLPLGETFYKAIHQYLGIEALIVSAAIPLGIMIDVDEAQEVGADRLANAVAASQLYPGTHSVVVDLGTATTFDVVASGNSFIGGMIAPGIGISIESLNKSTSLLPNIAIKKPNSVIGKNTIDNIVSGVVVGHAKMIAGLLQSIEGELGQKINVIGTGGFVDLIELYMDRRFDIKSSTITLDGLKHIYSLNRLPAKSAKTAI